MAFSRGIATVILQKIINPFQLNAPFLYSLKPSENLWFSDIFRSYRNETLG